ncbi:centromere/kinetochore protein zw10 [Anaeramoeba flamelloides]|uniref:Centromere/kinetochore protein zw10 n=1 Tax=Anaeramoeba flamelloides TaxID=1746091 RepID=A0ABQ8Z2Q0_9EUKA|nr:centromere/kinetochore protein zw10 [Anaeramoeba flamelloides]
MTTKVKESKTKLQSGITHLNQQYDSSITELGKVNEKIDQLFKKTNNLEELCLTVKDQSNDLVSLTREIREKNELYECVKQANNLQKELKKLEKLLNKNAFIQASKVCKSATSNFNQFSDLLNKYENEENQESKENINLYIWLKEDLEKKNERLVNELTKMSSKLWEINENEKQKSIQFFSILQVNETPIHFSNLYQSLIDCNIINKKIQELCNKLYNNFLLPFIDDTTTKIVIKEFENSKQWSVNLLNEEKQQKEEKEEYNKEQKEEKQKKEEKENQKESETEEKKKTTIEDNQFFEKESKLLAILSNISQLFKFLFTYFSQEKIEEKKEINKEAKKENEKEKEQKEEKEINKETKNKNENEKEKSNNNNLKTIIKLIGKELVNKLINLVAEKYLKPLLVNKEFLFHKGSQEIYLKIQKKTKKFEILLNELGFIPTKEETLTTLLSQIIPNHINLIKGKIIFEARELMLTTDHSMVQIESRKEENENENEKKINNQNETQFQSQLQNPFEFESCQISINVQKIVEIIRNALNDSINSEFEEVSIALFQATRDIIYLFKTVYLSHHFQQFLTIPHFCSIFYNDCQYISYNLLLLCAPLRTYFPKTNLMAIATLVDLIPELKRIGNQTYMDMLMSQANNQRGFLNISNGDLREIQQSFRRIKHGVGQIAKMCEKVLQKTMFQKTLIFLHNFFGEEIINQIIQRGDIYDEEATVIQESIKLHLQFINSSMNNVDDEQSRLQLSCFERLEIVGQLFVVKLDTIRKMLQEKKLNIFTQKEIVSLIEVLFSKDTKRTEFIEEVKKTIKE